MTRKELLNKVKAAFLGEPLPAGLPVAAADPAAVAPTMGVATPFKLQDGTDITINIDDPTVSTSPDMGDMVMIGGIAAPAGDYVLEDGSKFTVDATGAITSFTGTEPATQPDFNAPPVPTLEERVAALESKGTAFSSVKPEPIGEVPATIKGIHALYAAFATGTPEERIANLEMVAKALMEATFGWQLREAEQKATADQAMNVYKQGLITTPAQMQKQEEAIKGLFELCEELIKEPTADPVTLNGKEKEGFASQKEQRINDRAKVLQELKGKRTFGK